jgi:hypothetical protein
MGTPETPEALGLYPPWDGGPDRQLPPGAYTDHIDLLEDLRDLDGFPEEANLEVFELLKGYRITRIRTAEFAVSDDGHGLIILWLPYYEDHRMFEPGNHIAIPTWSAGATPRSHSVSSRAHAQEDLSSSPSFTARRASPRRGTSGLTSYHPNT